MPRNSLVTALVLFVAASAHADPHKKPPAPAPLPPVAHVDAPSPPSASPGPVVGVFPFTGAADPAVRASLTDDARAAIGATAGFTAQPAHAIDDALQAAKALGLACTLDKAACAVQMGGLAGCDLVVVGTVTGDATAPVIDAHVYDVAAVRELRAAHVSAAARAPSMKVLAVRLLAPERERARIHVRATPDGSTLLVDGVARGALGSRTVEVKPGKHEIYVAKPGFDSKVESVDVKFDDDASLEITLTPSTSAPAAIPFSLAEPPSDVPVSSSSSSPHRLLRVAFYELKAPDYPERVPRVVTEALLAEMRKLDGISVVGLDEIKALLSFEADRQTAGCSADASCLADIAGALGADIVIVGSLTHLGDSTVFGLRRLDQRTAQTTAQVNKSFVDANGEEYIAAVGDVVAQLFADMPLHPGMRRGADPKLALRVNPPPLQPWVLWTTLASASVLGVATAGAGVVNYNAATHYRGVTDDVKGVDVVANDRLTTGTAVAVVTGISATAVALAAAGVESLFVDWWGYGNAPGRAGDAE